MQRPFPRLPSIVKMQSVRFLLFRRSVLFPSESKLLHISRCLSFSAPTSFSTQNRTSVSYFHRRSFYSDEQILGEESGDSAAKAWFTSDLISEQTDTRPETGDGNVISGFTEKKDSPKEEVVFINCNSAGSGDEENKAKHSLKGFRKEHNSSFARAGRSFAGNKAGSKLKSSYICTECGGQYSKWWGKCPTCNTSDSVKKKEASSIDDKTVKAAPPQRLVDVNRGMCQSDWRIPLDGHLGMEVARVLGGGLVPGSLVLLGGDPGVGKTTLVLQIAAMISQCSNSRGPTHVLYVSGEESIEQMVSRAGRLQIMSEDLYFYSSTEVEIILDHAYDLSPIALIVDSIQTVYLKSIIGSAGNISQVKECTLKLQQFAKQANVTVLLIGHVTKTGDIAGPRMLEHMVDVVLYMEGERYSPYRLLRSVKNRFGTTDELGLLEMTKSGIQAVSNPSQMFLSESFSDSDILAGLALAIIVDGSRAFVIEIQALCVSDTSVARHVNGIQASRADMIIAVLMKQAGLKLQDNAIFLNIVSGFKLTETAGDLAIAAAICSSFLEFPIPFDTAFIGEVGLSGELRMVPRMDKRVSAAAKLGFKRCIVPKAALSSLSSLDGNMEIIGCRVLKDVINEVFTPL